MASLDQNIAPEILNDGLALFLTEICARGYGWKHVLEVGSSNGAGSTTSLVQGLLRNTDDIQLHCLEVSAPRFAELEARMSPYDFVHCYRMSAVAQAANMEEAELKRRWHESATLARDFPVEQWLTWRREGMEYIAGEDLPDNGIEAIKAAHGIEHFDFVFLDGYDFAGEAELDAVYGAKVIAMDDIHSFKNQFNYERLRDDPAYEEVMRHDACRNGCAAFWRKDDLAKVEAEGPPIHFFTLVLNGLPYLEYHYEVFRQLPFRWHWHIVEGVATLSHDTAWSVKNGGRVPEKLHHRGHSIDGTITCLKKLKDRDPERITVHVLGQDQAWDGKNSMCNQALMGVNEACLLWQVDNDELWTVEQITKLRRMFIGDPSRTAARFACNFFVGPDKVISTRGGYADESGNWWRVWKFAPGMRWIKHEPPTLVADRPGQKPVNLATLNPFTKAETEAAGLVFQHYAYATELQLTFKEAYYGYAGAVDGWKRLQAAPDGAFLAQYFPWAKDDSRVSSVAKMGIERLAITDGDGKCHFPARDVEAPLAVAVTGEAPPKVVIDGVFFQRYNTGIARVWRSLLECWSGTPFGDRIVLLDRGGTAPAVFNIRRTFARPHNYQNLAGDQAHLEALCRTLKAGVFTSTYYSRPLYTPMVQLVHDFIPDKLNADLNLVEWRERNAAFAQAERWVSVSHNTQRDLQHHFPHLDKARMSVAHNGLSDHFCVPLAEEVAEFRQRYGLTAPYWLAMAGFQEYKNPGCIYAGWGRSGFASQSTLVHTGRHATPMAWRAQAPGGIVQNLVFNERELPLAYAGATALIAPSFYEGFGMPLVEAMACGCPVLSSDIPVSHEVAGDAALFFDPRNPEALAQAMRQVVEPDLRSEMVTKGFAQAQKFSWEVMATELARVLSAVADQRETVTAVPAVA